MPMWESGTPSVYAAAPGPARPPETPASADGPLLYPCCNTHLRITSTLIHVVFA
jgi:hypothetical protein